MWPPRSTTIINNNIGFMPPRIHHCGGGFGNAFKWMLGFNMAQNMMTSLFSAFKPQSYMQMTPYYNFTSTPYYMPGMTPMQVDTMSTARRTLDSLGFTKESGYSVSMGEDGKLTYTYTDGTTTITASNLKELLNKQAEVRQSSEGDNNWFVASEGDEGEGVDTVVADDTPESETIADSAVTPYSNRVSRPPQGWYRAQNATSTTYRFTKEQLTAHEGAETSVDFIVKAFNAFKFDDKEINNAVLRDAIIKNNPSVFDEDGNLKQGADVSKLDNPTYKWIKENATQAKTEAPKPEPKVLAMDGLLDGRRLMKYESGNYIYKKNANGRLDDDAIFHIGGYEYTITTRGKGDTKLDYCQITGNRKRGFDDFKLIDPGTGRFNGAKDMDIWGESYSKIYRLHSEDGNGPLDGAVIKRNEKGEVIISKDGKWALMNDVMSKNTALSD